MLKVFEKDLEGTLSKFLIRDYEIMPQYIITKLLKFRIEFTLRDFGANSNIANLCFNL